jgi:hypothetical protein
MRNIVLHGVVRGEVDAAGALAKVFVAGHAFGLATLLIRVEGPRGTLETAAGANPRTHQWLARFDDADGLRDAGFALGVKVRVVAADLSDPDGCYSSSTSTVEAG